jgi:hypothetical protein
MLKTALFIVLGFGSGTLGALVVAHRAPPPRLEATAASEGAGVELERRAAMVALAATAARETGELKNELARPNEPNPAAEDPRDLRASREHELSVQAGLIEAHRGALRDSVWASEHETKLRGDYDGLAKTLGFTLGDVDCRTHTCVVDLQFPSTSAARSHLRELVQPHGLPCGARVTLPESSTADAPLMAEVYIECPEGT